MLERVMLSKIFVLKHVKASKDAGENQLLKLSEFSDLFRH